MGFTQGSATRPGPEIFDLGFQHPGFFDPEKNLILNPARTRKKLENTEIKKKY